MSHLNQRFANGRNEDGIELSESGLLVHLFDGLDDYDRPWMPCSETWRARVLEWGDTHASAAWFPCLLGFIGFMDPFTLCGFLVTPLLTLGLCVADRSWAFVLCAAVWLGCLAGNLAFVALIGRLGLAAKFTGSPHLATAAELLQRHGPMAGVVNTNPGPNPDPNPSPSPNPNPDPDPDRNPNPIRTLTLTRTLALTR